MWCIRLHAVGCSWCVIAQTNGCTRTLADFHWKLASSNQKLVITLCWSVVFNISKATQGDYEECRREWLGHLGFLHSSFSNAYGLLATIGISPPPDKHTVRKCMSTLQCCYVIPVDLGCSRGQASKIFLPCNTCFGRLIESAIFLGQALLGLCCEKQAKFMCHGFSFQLWRVVKTSRKTHVTNKFSSVCYMTHTRCGVKYGIQSRCKSSWPAPSPMLVAACRGHQIPVEELHQTEIQVTRTEHSKIKGYYAKQLQLHAIKWKYNSECWFKCIFYISAILIHVQYT